MAPKATASVRAIDPAVDEARTPAAPSPIVPPASETAAPTTGAVSTASAPDVTVTFVRFDCDAYEFQVLSTREALYKVHWTSRSPVDPDPVDARVVSDAEVSQSPGEHTFQHSEQDWSERGSNELRVTAWDVAGASVDEARVIDC
jgi:hypothetical protein